MKLTSKGRFAVTSLVDLALNSRGKPVKLSHISSRQNISLPFLEQIFYCLRNKNIVKSVRGPGGGYLFARQPEFVMILDIIDAIDEKLMLTMCTGSLDSCVQSQKKSKCLTHNLWSELSTQIESFLGSISIKDVINNQFIFNSAKKNVENFRTVSRL